MEGKRLSHELLPALGVRAPGEQGNGPAAVLAAALLPGTPGLPREEKGRKSISVLSLPTAPPAAHSPRHLPIYRYPELVFGRADKVK